MIIKSRYKFTPTCDGCGAELEPEYDFYDAVAFMKSEGWQIVQPDKASPQWYHFCPACKERGKKDG